MVQASSWHPLPGERERTKSTSDPDEYCFRVESLPTYLSIEIHWVMNSRALLFRKISTSVYGYSTVGMFAFSTARLDVVSSPVRSSCWATILSDLLVVAVYSTSVSYQLKMVNQSTYQTARQAKHVYHRVFCGCDSKAKVPMIQQVNMIRKTSKSH